MRIAALVVVLTGIISGAPAAPFEENSTTAILAPDTPYSAAAQQVLGLISPGPFPELPQNPDECLQKGRAIWDRILTAKADTPRATTTDKYLASYPPYFTGKYDITTKPDPEDYDLGNQIMSALNRETLDGAELKNPLFPGLPATLKERDTGDIGAYELVFAPGLIVAVASFKSQDPVKPASAQVNWDVIAMELYKEYRDKAGPKDLKYVLRFHVLNPVTRAVLEKLYRDAKMEKQIYQDDTDWVKWDPTKSRAGLDAVCMLLGTDNGSGAGYILVDYKVTVGRSGIAAIHTRRSDGQWAMAIEYA
ncbi:hypothetical protein DFH09DRAFT_1472359 [Mycena vulgaris]|nr:hypothetical protein DFH09DRAFT_1472359 [Mycena vulgaris]